MLRFLANRLQSRPVNACFCTLAIHKPYRERARLLVGDAPQAPWIILTDEPQEFAGLPVQAIRHVPAGPMAIDFVTRLPPLANPAYHDKRFVLQAALKEFETAIFVDADTRIGSLPRLPVFRPGIAVVKDLNASIAEHLTRWGSDRRPAFEKRVTSKSLTRRNGVARDCLRSLKMEMKKGSSRPGTAVRSSCKAKGF
jgi:hypothetical protein